MKFWEVVTSAISKLWKFCTLLVKIGLLMAFALFVLTIFLPDQVLNAIEIVKGIF
jgi:hypothetical protein